MRPKAPRKPTKPAKGGAGKHPGVLAKFAVHNPDVAWRIVDGEAAIVTPADGTLHLLNEVGTAIWLSAQKAVKLSAVVDELVEEYEVKRSTAENDVAAFAEELQAKQMLLVASSKKALPAG